MATWEIIPGKLWQGDLFSLSNPDGVDVCVSCTLLSEMPAPFTFHAIYPFVDGPQLPDMLVLSRVVRGAAYWLRDGKKMLINCNEGCNRSGLAIGMTMSILGMQNILATIQAAHPKALYNPVFAQYVAGLG